jgi:anti-anti-sigma regulatory factor
MYRIHKTIKDNQLIIYIEGRLNNIDEIVSIIKEDISNVQTKEVIVDLAKLEFISDKCLNLLQHLKSTYNLKFKNYSGVYTEMRLNEFQLLSDENE